MTSTEQQESSAPPPLTRQQVTLVFIGLMLGMFVASLNMTVVAPAMPRIVAELGGFEYYSWIALSAMLGGTVIVPVVGKLSDLYGRKPFYIGGLAVFLLGSLFAGLASSFWAFVGARFIQGLGSGTLMPLSQAIIGDIAAPRERGKYQGLMGGVFGLSSVAGPLIGGLITDHLTWRWLFFVNLPIGVVALFFITRFMLLPHVGRRRSIDYAGFATLSVALTTGLLATSWGGGQYPWTSPQILGLYAACAVFLAIFIVVELRAEEPALPLGLWANRVFTLSNVASMGLSVAMFGAIFYIPVFAQGVLGVSVQNSGNILVPLMLTMIITSTLNGLFITRTGYYKPQVLLGLAAMGIGFWLLGRMNISTTQAELMRNMTFIGLGIGLSMQTFTLVVQNAVAQSDLGVATSATQFSRNIGSSVGVAILGTMMNANMQAELPKRIPSEALATMGDAADQLIAEGAGLVLDPERLQQLPPILESAIREGLGAALPPVFGAALPFLIVSLILAIMIPALPLRRRLDSKPEAAAAAGKGRTTA